MAVFHWKQVINIFSVILFWTTIGIFLIACSCLTVACISRLTRRDLFSVLSLSSCLFIFLSCFNVLACLCRLQTCLEHLSFLTRCYPFPHFQPARLWQECCFFLVLHCYKWKWRLSIYAWNYLCGISKKHFIDFFVLMSFLEKKIFLKCRSRHF